LDLALQFPLEVGLRVEGVRVVQVLFLVHVGHPHVVQYQVDYSIALEHSVLRVSYSDFEGLLALDPSLNIVVAVVRLSKYVVNVSIVSKFKV